MTAIHDDLLAFEGQAFDGLPTPAAQPTHPATDVVVRPGTPVAEVTPEPVVPTPVPGDHAARVVARLRESIITAHASALATQETMQRWQIAALTGQTPVRAAAERTTPRPDDSAPTWAEVTPAAAPVQDSVVRHGAVRRGAVRHYVVTAERTDRHLLVIAATEVPSPAQRRYAEPATTEGAFKPLAQTTAVHLGSAELDRLRAGDIAGVFGPAYDQDGANPHIRLFATEHGVLSEVTRTVRRAGRWNHGTLHARCLLAPGDPVAAITEVAAQAAQVIAVNLGLHLCLPDATFEVHGGEVELVGAAEGELALALELSDVDMVPRPRLTAEVELSAGGTVVARVHGLRLEVRERPGVAIGPAAGGVVPGWFGRRNADGERALLNEFHMIHSSRGDLAITLGPEFARCLGRRATRMPSGGLRLCDRVMRVDGERHKLASGSGDTEYDAHADSWYFAETANASMPNVIYMETSLQSALLLGYFLGATLTDPDDDFSLRNLDGSATVLREVDLRGKTIRQHSELINTSVLSGAVLQSFSYELSVDGEPFYRGESLFGFFNEKALANQTGLDGGAYVPTWLDQHPTATRRIEVGERGPNGPARSTAHLHLLDEVHVVDGGGEHGLGYLRAVRPISADDWYFRRHFHLDPVMPGSLGVEAVLQAMQEWLVDTGLADELVAPEFVLPTGLALSWRYRGQILATDGEMTLEVHIKRVERGDQRVRVVGDASVWKPGMRIYQLDDVAVECRGVGAK
ncbi:beta-hydroxydecanoyl-ACP dehydratase [Actinokineospora sp. NBRC 105648]|uniref:beta-hydroxydecanoyl-ACP dehydratase n=1 Tax=Actinokineospora sp. NBRC 105648 TaxID=3032206 RepID=UPI0024A5DEC3|nr:beta-hydroxydecanoyl-ACP dehydratase [Actinokineospora sp. NBRC 105648]GLZ36541.1 hypothetical protein Acsp05_01660 [Actinokineospora sp. NBRC 105648]